MRSVVWIGGVGVVGVAEGVVCGPACLSCFSCSCSSQTQAQALMFDCWAVTPAPPTPSSCPPASLPHNGLEEGRTRALWRDVMEDRKVGGLREGHSAYLRAAKLGAMLRREEG